MIAQRRGKNVANVGAVAHAVFTAVMLAIWLSSGSLSAKAALYFVAGGVPLWLMVAMLFHCRQLCAGEEAELHELASTAAAAGRIFQADQQIRPAANRLAMIERWVVPIFTVLLVAYHAGIGFVTLTSLWRRVPGELGNLSQATLFTVLVAFVGFLLSRYCIGMSRGADWRPLRATGSYLLANVLAMAAVAAALLAATQGYVGLDLVVAYALPLIQVVLAAEFGLNLVLDFYRPRLPSQEVRYSFDSRLFNLLAEPARVGHSLAEALNYQFGFEVSKTWFYRLAAGAIVPLIIFAVLVLFALSSIVLVHDGQQALIFHLGQADPQRPVLGAGLHLKWPWPIDRAEIFEVGQVHEVRLGIGGRRSADDQSEKIMLWSQEHGRHKELDFLIAIPSARLALGGVDREKAPPPVNIIKLVMTVHYSIADAYKYGYEFTDPDAMLQCLAYREMTRYCASATLDEPIPGGAANRPEAIMSFGRQRAAQELKHLIQAATDEMNLGIDICHVLIEAAHPPADAAAAFEQVLQAQLRQDEMRYKAEADANKVLAKVAGDETTALRLAQAIRRASEFTELSRIAAGGNSFDAKLGDYIRGAETDLQRLADELSRERLRGKLRGDEPTARLRLLESYQRHVAHLRQVRDIASAGGDADLAARAASAKGEADQLLSQAAGRPAVLVADAEAARWSTELTERARAEAFKREMIAYQAAPEVYMLDRWLDVWDEVLPDIEKYVLGVDRERIQIWLNTEREVEGLERVTFGSDGSAQGE